MRNIQLFCFILLVSGFSIHSQNKPLGTWQLHNPFTNINSVSCSENSVYASAFASLLIYNPEDQSTQILDPVNALSDKEIRLIKYDKSLDVLFIGYTNSNVDILHKDGRIVNMPELALKVLSGDKLFYNAYYYDSLLYVSTGFGIQVINPFRAEFPESYIIGTGGSRIKVNDFTEFNGKFYAASTEGLKYIRANNPGILNYAFWIKDTLNGQPNKVPNHIETCFNKMFGVYDDSIFVFDGVKWKFVWGDSSGTIVSLNAEGNRFLVSVNELKEAGKSVSKIFEIDSLLNIRALEIPSIGYLSSSCAFGDKVIIGDLFRGLGIYSTSGTQVIERNGPQSRNCFRLKTYPGKLIMCAGAYNGSIQGSFNVDGFSIYQENWWTNVSGYNRSELNGVYDIVDATYDERSGKYYFASILSGLVEMDKNGNLTLYDKDNSIIKANPADPLRSKVSDVEMDKDGNLWITNFASDFPIVIKKADNTWTALSGIPGVSGQKQILIDKSGQKWFPLKGSSYGLMVFDEGGTIDNTSDDTYRLLGNGPGNGNLPENTVNCIVEDKEGNIWVGTNQGIGIFYCPERVIRDGCDAQRVIVTRDGYNAYLFESEFVNTIAVDGANRKWVGTSNGVWLISEDGKEEILRFDINNSPLPSNEILDIDIEPLSGEVFIATESGLISYRGDATEGGEVHGEVLVYPNPVNPDYFGPIAIKGLAENSYVKITDIGGG